MLAFPVRSRFDRLRRRCIAAVAAWAAPAFRLAVFCGVLAVGVEARIARADAASIGRALFEWGAATAPEWDDW